jgi:hypothetical protein
VAPARGILLVPRLLLLLLLLLLLVRAHALRKARREGRRVE